MIYMSLVETLRHLFHPRRSNNHRPRLLHPEAYLSLALLIVAFSAVLRLLTTLNPEYSQILGFASDITAEEVVALTNQQRLRSGAGAVQANPQLTAAATAKARDMFEDQYWAHVAPDGTEPWTFIQQSGYSYRFAGENLARDFDHTPAMIAAWIASPSHRQNLLNSRYTDIGVAVVDGVLNGTETTLVVQMFGTTPAQAAQLPPRSAAIDINTEFVRPVQPQAGINPRELAFLSTDQEVLAGADPQQLAAQLPPLISPLELSKAFFLALIFVLVVTLIYDTVVITNSNVVRLVGKNIAHIMLLTLVAYILIFFEAGVVG